MAKTLRRWIAGHFDLDLAAETLAAMDLLLRVVCRLL